MKLYRDFPTKKKGIILVVTGILGGTTQNISFTISSAVMDEVLVFLPGWHEIVTLLHIKM